MSVIVENERKSYWRELRYEPDDADEWPYRPKGADKECQGCPHGKMIYHQYSLPGYFDRYKSIMCMPGKVLICKQGFIKKEEFNV